MCEIKIPPHIVRVAALPCSDLGNSRLANGRTARVFAHLCITQTYSTMLSVTELDIHEAVRN